MAIMTYLLRDPRTGIYHHRRAIPAALRSAFNGKGEIKRSLGTKDHKEAKRRNQEVGPEVDRLLQSARDTLDGYPVLDTSQADALAARWLHKALHEDTEGRALGGGGSKDAGHLADFLGDVREALAAPVNLKFVRTHVRDVLEAEGLVIPEGTEAHRMLSLAMLRALSEFSKVALERSQGRWSDTGVAPPDAPVVVGAGRPVRRASKADTDAAGLKLSALLEARLAEGRPVAKTENGWRTVFRRLTEVIGADVPVRAVTKAHVRDFKNALLRCPTRMKASLRRRTLPDIVEITKDQEGIERLSPASVNKALSAVSAVFSWAVANGYADTNVATGMKVKVKDRERARLSFSKEDLIAIFGERHSRCRDTDPELFWLPLLALYTGARLEELGQALVSDIKEDQGITFLDINDEGDKHLKNATAKRKVPLHPALVRAGFLEYVAERRVVGDGRLFPRLRPNSEGALTGTFSKRFGTWLRGRAKVTDTRKVFHSFRHTFKDAGRAVPIPKEVNDALTGHSSGDEGSKYGSEGVPLKIKAAELRKITYPGVEVSE